MNPTIVLITLILVSCIGIVLFLRWLFRRMAQKALGAIHIEPGWPEGWR